MITNLIFRNVDDEIQVLFRNGTAEDPFSYVELIKHLLKGEELAATEFDDKITEEEKASVKSMIDEINGIVNDVVCDSKE